MLQSEVAPLRRVLMKHARDAFVGSDRVAEQWEPLGYPAPPDYEAACRESDALAELFESLGTEITWMPAADRGLDSIYVRDASITSDAGAILCRMGKGARAAEPAAAEEQFAALDVEVLGAIEEPGTLEGGDVAWLDPQTLAVGLGYRTNISGIEQLSALLAPDVEVITVSLPHWKGAEDVFHLMSMLSPLADDLLLVYSPLLPVPFRSDLLDAGFELVEVPNEEFEMGCNVLATAPRVAVALEGFPETRRRMEDAGVEVHTYGGKNISALGAGGPTCLTRPLERG